MTDHLAAVIAAVYADAASFVEMRAEDERDRYTRGELFDAFNAIERRAAAVSADPALLGLAALSQAAPDLARQCLAAEARNRCLEAEIAELVKVNAELKASVWSNVRQVLHSKTDSEISGAMQAEIERAIVKAFAPKEMRHD